MTKLDEIRNRRLAPTDIAKIEAMAEISEPEAGVAVEEIKEMKRQAFEGGEEGLLPPTVEKQVEDKPVNDVAFYGPRVNEFYRYFLDGNAPGIAAQLALAACTLKASVVIGQAITDTFGTVLPGIAETPAIPVKANVPAITGRKKGRPVGSKNKK
jgi:hypothetical protein